YLPATGGPTVSSWGPGRLDVFINGDGPDSADIVLLHAWLDQGQWHDFENLGKSEIDFWYDPPAAISWGLGRIDVFERSDPRWVGGNTLRHKWFDNGQWSSWENLGGTTMSAPTLGSWTNNHLAVFIRNANTGLSVKSFNTGWGNWEIL